MQVEMQHQPPFAHSGFNPASANTLFQRQQLAGRQNAVARKRKMSDERAAMQEMHPQSVEDDGNNFRQTSKRRRRMRIPHSKQYTTPGAQAWQSHGTNMGNTQRVAVDVGNEANANLNVGSMPMQFSDQEPKEEDMDSDSRTLVVAPRTAGGRIPMLTPAAQWQAFQSRYKANNVMPPNDPSSRAMVIFNPSRPMPESNAALYEDGPRIELVESEDDGSTSSADEQHEDDSAFVRFEEIPEEVEEDQPMEIE